MFAELTAPIRGAFLDLPVMILGFFDNETALCIDSEGGLVVIRLEDKALKADIRFDYSKKEWVDLNPMAEES